MDDRYQTVNECQAGHTAHRTRTIPTRQGPFTVYDWQTYAGFAGYCPGQDDLSMTLDLYGVWEEPDWTPAVYLIREGDYVWDIGSHIGWYTRGFVDKGAAVYAVDADPANMALHGLNAPTGTILRQTAWAADMVPPAWPHLRMIKADIEGKESDVVEAAWPWITTGRVDYLLLECSPEFNSGYPDLIDRIRAAGYRATILGEEIAGKDLGPVQKNVWFARRTLQ